MDIVISILGFLFVGYVIFIIIQVILSLLNPNRNKPRRYYYYEDNYSNFRDDQDFSYDEYMANQEQINELLNDDDDYGYLPDFDDRY